MHRRTWSLTFIFACTIALCASAQEVAPEKSTPPLKETAPKQGKSLLNPPSPADAITSATIEQIMDQAVKNIARRYNLNDAQKEETQKLMKREVMRFLQEHEADVWPAIRDLLTIQIDGKLPESKEAIERLGKVGKPLTKLAQQAIFEANDEWRLYLNPDQKRIHDFDMAEMRETFSQIDRNMDRLEKGEMPDGGVFPPPKPVAGGPPKPRKPADGLPKPEIFEINIFENFVENFIKEFGLDPAQTDAARSILNETKTKADAFKLTKEQELLKVAMEKKAAAETRDRDRKEKAEAMKKDLLKPIDALFGEFEGRLKGLLTTAQLQKYEAKHAARSTPEERLRADSSQIAAKTTPPKPVAKPVQPPPTGDDKAINSAVAPPPTAVPANPPTTGPANSDRDGNAMKPVQRTSPKPAPARPVQPETQPPAENKPQP